MCLKHKCWVRREQVDLAAFSEALAAERHWRRSLARRGIVIESPIVRLDEDAATVGLSKNVWKARADRVADHSPGLLVYSETVTLARVGGPDPRCPLGGGMTPDDEKYIVLCYSRSLPQPGQRLGRRAEPTEDGCAR